MTKVLSLASVTKTSRSKMARVDQWEPRNSGSPKRKVWQTVGWFVLIIVFMGAAFAAITRPLPPIHVSHKHPTQVMWANEN